MAPGETQGWTLDCWQYPRGSITLRCLKPAKWTFCASPPVPQIGSKHMCQQRMLPYHAVLIGASGSLTTFQKGHKVRVRLRIT